MYKKITLLLLISFLALNTFAQSNRAATGSRYNYYLNTQVKKSAWNPNDFIGSPYYDNQFKLGNIYLNDSLLIKDVLLRYDVHKENLEIRSGMESEIETIQSKPGLAFDYGDEHFSLMFNPITGMKQYFRKVYEGPIYIVYLKPIKVFKEGQKAVTHLTRDILPSYLTKDTYYFQKGKQFEEVRTSRGGVRKIFPDHRNEIKEFIKEKEFRFRDETFESELTEVIRYYETLVNGSSANGEITR